MAARFRTATGFPPFGVEPPGAPIRAVLVEKIQIAVGALPSPRNRVQQNLADLFNWSGTSKKSPKVSF